MADNCGCEFFFTIPHFPFKQCTINHGNIVEHNLPIQKQNCLFIFSKYYRQVAQLAKQSSPRLAPYDAAASTKNQNLQGSGTNRPMKKINIMLLRFSLHMQRPRRNLTMFEKLHLGIWQHRACISELQYFFSTPHPIARIPHWYQSLYNLKSVSLIQILYNTPLHQSQLNYQYLEAQHFNQ